MYSIILSLLTLTCMISQCKKDPGITQAAAPVMPSLDTMPSFECYTTRADGSLLLFKNYVSIHTGIAGNGYPTIRLDTTRSYQSIDGFGFTLTGGSATLIHKMDEANRRSLLNELFSADKTNIQVLRISIGASDLSDRVFTYDDHGGPGDENLSKFSFADDTMDLIPVLKEIVAINPKIKLLGSPWTAPLWMKDNNNSIGGALDPRYYKVYASYLVRYIQEMQKLNFPLFAITLQNEPQHGGNNPSMVFSSEQEREFVKNHLGPAFKAAGISTKILVWDHNCDNPNYPINILNDPVARQYIDGSAFHLYNGSISALSTVHIAHPDKNLYFTEQWTGSNGTFSGDLMWHVRNVLIGSLKNWSRMALEWNLASDPTYSIHTKGGCTECKGGLTIQGSTVSKNVGYYIIAHASGFIPSGSIRMESNDLPNTINVFVKRPDGKKVLILLNDSGQEIDFNIVLGTHFITNRINGHTVQTYIWN